MLFGFCIAGKKEKDHLSTFNFSTHARRKQIRSTTFILYIDICRNQIGHMHVVDVRQRMPAAFRARHCKMHAFIVDVTLPSFLMHHLSFGERIFGSFCF